MSEAQKKCEDLGLCPQLGSEWVKVCEGFAASRDAALAHLAAAEARAEQAERERDEAQSLLRDRSPLFQDYEDAKRDNARLSSRLATVEAALIRLRAGCMVSAGTACRLCHGTWLREDGETAADHHDGCPLRETAPGAALAATPAAGEVE